VGNTAANSYLAISFVTSDGTAEHATQNKCTKYAALSSTLLLQPKTFDTLWPNITSETAFVNELHSRLSSVV
jgi:hypothetical protein